MARSAGPYGGESGERKLASDVVLLETFRAAVARLNPELPAEAVTAAVDRALTGSSPILIVDHQDFHETLLAGVPVSWLAGADGEQSTRAKLIDWDEPANNMFEVVDQLTVWRAVATGVRTCCSTSTDCRSASSS